MFDAATMIDPRIQRLAETIVDYSLAVQPGERVLIDWMGNACQPLIQAVIAVVAQRQAVPLWNFADERFLRELLLHGSEAQLKAFGETHRRLMAEAQCYVGIRGNDNIYELNDVPEDRRKWYMQHFMGPVHWEQRVGHTRWVVLRYPNAAMAQLAKTSGEAFANFYFQTVNIDYKRLSAAMAPLHELMVRTDRVRIVSPDTELNFSIKGIAAVSCDGHLNLPDGEVFTAPVRDSINGTILFNASTPYLGTAFSNVRLTFKAGKIVEARCDGNTATLEKILNLDEGARYIGEFAIGFHPYIREPMQDILFDEKIAGSLHMAIGNDYDMAPNGNVSQIHWDLVQIQRPEWGGGEIYFDGRLIRKDGHFVVPELAGLNPEALGASSA